MIYVRLTDQEQKKNKHRCKKWQCWICSWRVALCLLGREQKGIQQSANNYFR
jgi:hypothetical protein